MKIVENSMLTVTKTIPVNRHWFKQLILDIQSWNPCNDVNNSRFEIIHEPSTEVYISDDLMICHPAIAAELRKLLTPAEKAVQFRSSLGFYGMPVINNGSLLDWYGA